MLLHIENEFDFAYIDNGGDSWSDYFAQLQEAQANTYTVQM